MSDKRLIEDYLPIKEISEEASSEPRTKGHISTLHVWRARRPLVACRAAVYGALVPAVRFIPENGPNSKKQSLGRANAAKFVAKLCKYPGDAKVIAEAQRHILEAHAERLTAETGKSVTADDIVAGKAPRPKVLDMFAGGGAIPLEAARLGCESHALDLNPVAYLIELCTLTFPQQYGSELADDIESWGRLVLERTHQAVSDVLSRIPIVRDRPRNVQTTLGDGGMPTSPQGEYSVVAYYWTRTIPCPSPQCKGTVPLYRQTWLRNKSTGFVALRPIPDMTKRVVRFEVVEAQSEEALGFDPSLGSEGSSAVCPFCQTVLSGPYVRRFGDEHGFGQQLMCVITLNPNGPGKLYLVDEALAECEGQRQVDSESRAAEIERELGPNSLDEEIQPTGNAGLATGNSYLYGIRTFRQAFTPRQRYILLTMAREVRRAHVEMIEQGMGRDRAKVVTTYLGLWLSRLTDRFNTLARWRSGGETVESLASMKRLAMMWDYPELNIFGGASGDAWGSLEYMTAFVRQEGHFRIPGQVRRGSATELPYDTGTIDAVVTDPPYYDNESYSELSDVCYVWLTLTVGFLYPDHFASRLSPKKKECVAAAYRQGGKQKAWSYYEDCLFRSFQEADRVTKPSGILAVVYAHKTTLGWATLVDALRRAGFEVVEAWPLATEAKSRVAHHGDAVLASSIFLVARKRRCGKSVGKHAVVRRDLESIVRERVASLWEAGISGADLRIACVGAGMKAFTQFERVEMENGEEVTSERFLREVEALVQETLLERLLGSKSSLAGMDAVSQFYVLWRFDYQNADVDAGEAIVFSYPHSGVELDGAVGLSSGKGALLLKTGKKYRAGDFTERGDEPSLGMAGRFGLTEAPLIDVLHRLLWLMENRTPEIPSFLDQAHPNTEQLRLLAEVLAGETLRGSGLKITTDAEQSAVHKLTGNWAALVDENLFHKK